MGMGQVVPLPDKHADTRRADAELTASCLQGNLAAFDVLVERYQNRVYGHALRMLGDEEMAREAAQDVFLRAFRNLSRFRGDAAFATWLFTIVVSTCRNMASYNRVRDRRRLDPRGREFDSPEDPVAALPDTRPGPAAAVEQRETAGLLLSALHNLPEAHRQMLVLRDVNDFSYDDIARILGCPPGTVKSRIARARLLLREELVRLGYDGPGE
jgi:RNA polymerase sigma factor (sigma-70 family)